MNLKDLKKNATVSEFSLIETVERLVRDEYNLELMKESIHSELKDKIYGKVTDILKMYGLINLNHNEISMCDRAYMKNILAEIGYAVRLEVKPNIDI